MNKIHENKILADLIKADLKDILTNDSQWTVYGDSVSFHGYWDWWDKEIQIDARKKEELKKELEKKLH